MDWLDLARYADTYGYQADVDRDMSPYRDWVIQAFNQNLPYDQFLLWQLAGDLLPNATREQRIATAFNRLHRQTNEGGSIEEEFRTEYVVDRVNTFGTAMLGLTLECARCHDHKFDPITQRDYYSLFAFFNNIDESGLYSHFTNATPSPSLLLWPDAAGEAARAGEGAHRRGRSQADGDLPRREQAFDAWLEALSTGRAGHSTAHRRRSVSHPTPIAHLAFDVVEGDETPDSVSKSSAPGAGRAGARARAGCAGRIERGARVQRRQLRRPSRRPAVCHAPTLSRSPSPRSRPSCRIAPSSCISRARGRTPAAAASS